MFSNSLKQLKTALILLFILTLLTGFIYPAIVTGIAQMLFPWQANGSLLQVNGKTIGSHLIGQSFTDAKYFWGRPSATTPNPYNAANSGGSNSGPSNPDYLKTVAQRVADLKQADPAHSIVIPVDLVTASGSGLDPDISPDAAYYQISRIAKARGIPEQDLITLVQQSIQNRTLGILGDPRVNVLQLNLALDHLIAQKETR